MLFELNLQGSASVARFDCCLWTCHMGMKFGTLPQSKAVTVGNLLAEALVPKRTSDGQNLELFVNNILCRFLQ